MDKTTITRLLRVSWAAVAKIVIDVVADQLDAARLDGLFRIGVDEVSYRKGHRYLTVIADHDRNGAVVWAAEGRDAKTLEAFYDELGEERCRQLEAVSLTWAAPTRRRPMPAPPRPATVSIHFICLAGQRGRRQDPPLGLEPAPRPRPHHGGVGQADPLGAAQSPDQLHDFQLDVLDDLRRNRSVLYRGWQLKEGVRDLFRLADPTDAAAHLDRWLAWACRSRIPAFVALSRTVRANRDRIVAAVELGLSNSKLEGLILWSADVGVVDVADEPARASWGRVLWSVSSRSTISRAA